jgi:hypothetical protein
MKHWNLGKLQFVQVSRETTVNLLNYLAYDTPHIRHRL